MGHHHHHWQLLKATLMGIVQLCEFAGSMPGIPLSLSLPIISSSSELVRITIWLDLGQPCGCGKDI
jgi:hypothetical protein